MQYPQKPNDEKPGKNPEPPPQFRIPRWVWPLAWVLIIAWLFFIRLPDMVNNVTDQSIDIPYSFFFQQVDAGNVTEVTIQDTQVTGVFKSAVTWPPAGSAERAQGIAPETADHFSTTLLPVQDPALVTALHDNNVSVTAQPVETNAILLFLLNFGPLLLLLGFFIWSARRTQGQMSGIFGFGRTQAREYNVEKPRVTFTDVAGQDSAKSELMEVVDFLKEPDKYIALGARIPRGVLLVGPPGTGKTLMARAVAGEASVAFFSIAASEFVEMFVGVGASRVRDLFKRAKDAAPSIVFIDELDAVGRQRGAGLGGGHDEREQTLNQMLAEMDGFDQNESVIVMAATNRPDVLDPALLRPGRFDRQVTVGLPDRAGRLDILKIHTRGKPLTADANLDEIAKATIGFSGADLANLANEAALTAARQSSRRISMRHFLEAFDRIVLGTESPPLSNQEERRVVAYHESGHALVALLTPGGDQVLKVTIIPRGQALGVTAQLPSDDRRNYARTYLMARIHMLLGGRAAEEVVIGDITTGASNDLQRATELARRMVAEFGMSEDMGPLNFGDHERQPFLGYSLAQGRQYSEETASRIDAEVRRIIENAHAHVLNLLRENRDKLEALAQALLTDEILDRRQILELIGMPLDEETEPAGTTPTALPDAAQS
ncbi:MAG: ATP-dependent metallopeptidase FtsH/Yme1/Tma family protein [Anaerolineaceae bacterium]|nr:ATP-dependent metallopeptidase FtsH/Yme1/Tma family protein [Anaerolineaceae bacterium]